jgi:hypothetical protein
MLRAAAAAAEATLASARAAAVEAEAVAAAARATVDARVVDAQAAAVAMCTHSCHAFSGSLHFSLLDKHSHGLRLVTDAVHEDDALYLALICRALRDALWERFPQRPAGDAHAGARVRTRDAAVVATVGRLAWARGLDRSWPGTRTSWYPASICETAARHGALASLQWARANGCDWTMNTCREAAEAGHLAVLQWAQANGCDWNADTCMMAVARGHLAVLQWAQANGCDCDEAVRSRSQPFYWAAEGGQLTVLQWLRANGWDWDEDTCTGAAGGGRLDVLQWLREND